eukprot:11750704-Heterocapsa_arctica.AAC.1
MEHDADEREIERFKKQTLDNTEWGGFDQIVMWSRICCVKIEIYSYSMDMQTVDGDEFIQEQKVCHITVLQQRQMGRTSKPL